MSVVVEALITMVLRLIGASGSNAIVYGIAHADGVVGNLIDGSVRNSGYWSCGADHTQTGGMGESGHSRCGPLGMAGDGMPVR